MFAALLTFSSKPTEHLHRILILQNLKPSNSGTRGPHFHSFRWVIYLQIFLTSISTLCVLKITFPLISFNFWHDLPCICVEKSWRWMPSQYLIKSDRWFHASRLNLGWELLQALLIQNFLSFPSTEIANCKWTGISYHLNPTEPSPRVTWAPSPNWFELLRFYSTRPDVSKAVRSVEELSGRV